MARPDVNDFKVVFGEIGDEEGDNEHPVQDAYQRIPNRHGLDVVRHDKRPFQLMRPPSAPQQGQIGGRRPKGALTQIIPAAL